MNWRLMTNFSRYCLLGVIWSTVVVFSGFQVISTAWSHACNGKAQDPQKRRITAVLFNLNEGDVDASTNYTYNDYSCHPEWAKEGILGYDGGHSGWDVQTNWDYDPGRNDRFYSITAGKVIRADPEKDGKSSVIAVYNSVYNITIIYLHARTVGVKTGPVKKGDYLGKQGNTGLNEKNDKDNSHVHVEVREGEWPHPSNGIAAAMLIDHDPIPINHDPIPILFKMHHDVNQDGKVNITDVVKTWLNIGANADKFRQYDINNDKIIDWSDVLLVFENRTLVIAAPPLTENTPNETLLLANYPNPFNPETWIPYQLAKDADVTLTISDIRGQLVRTLVLGHQTSGIYRSRSRAAYWDGKNDLGEPVASGVYFYTLTAGEFAATRKMLIRK